MDDNDDNENIDGYAVAAASVEVAVVFAVFAIVVVVVVAIVEIDKTALFITGVAVTVPSGAARARQTKVVSPDSTGSDICSCLETACDVDHDFLLLSFRRFTDKDDSVFGCLVFSSFGKVLVFVDIAAVVFVVDSCSSD